MKTPRLLALSIASLLLTPLATRAVTDIWDGGSLFSDNLDANLNWVDGTAPVSSLVNTDLIFAGSVRLTPNVSAEFSTRGITFNNTAGQFVIGGLELNVGPGGIVNNDAQTMIFTNPVDFSATGNVTINAAVGGLTFTDTVTLPSATLTVAGGGSSSFQEIGGPGTGELTTLVKTGSGVMTWRPNNFVTHFDVSLNAGTLTLAAGDGVVSFSNSSAIAVNGTSTFNLNENVTISGQLTRATGAASTSRREKRSR